MNSNHVQVIREALGAARHNVVMHYNKISDAPTRIARIDAALTALDEAAGWEMLPDGTEYIDGGDNYLTASLGGSLLSIIRSDLDEPDMDEECDTHSIQLDPNEYRLFRKRQPAQEPDA